MARLEDKREARDGLKLGRQSAIAAVDLGASKVGCFIMKPDGVKADDRTIQVAGVAHVKSRGVRGGAIVNLEEAAQAVAQAVERAETMAGVSISGVVLTTTAAQLASARVLANVSLGARPITDADLSRAIQMALVLAVAALHTECFTSPCGGLEYYDSRWAWLRQQLLPLASFSPTIRSICDLFDPHYFSRTWDLVGPMGRQLTLLKRHTRQLARQLGATPRTRTATRQRPSRRQRLPGSPS